MDISSLREFITLAEVGNYMAAADNLFLSQPTLSRHIKKLEDDLGMPLFDRNPRKVELNQAGKIFLPYAKQILEIERAYMRDFQKLDMEKCNVLRIGTFPMMVAYGVTGLFQEFRKLYPDTSLILTEMHPQEMLKALHEKQYDFFFVRETEETDDGFARIQIGEDCLSAVLSVEHPLAHQERISLSQLKDENLLLPAEGSSMYYLCLRVCHEAGFEPKISFMSSGTATAMDLASRQMGIALLMKRPCQSEHQDKVVIIEIAPKIKARISVVYRKDGIKSPTAAHFLEMIRKRYPDSSCQ